MDLRVHRSLHHLEHDNTQAHEDLLMVTNHLPPGVEYVVLTNETGAPIGTAAKATVHTNDTPLHKAFSSFLFTNTGELLITQRALTKKTWAGVWTNSCCGHPKLEETEAEAATRRIDYELGMRAPPLELILPSFRYFVERDGVVEREHCPVLVGFTNDSPKPNPEEVGDWARVPWNEYVTIATALKPHLPSGTPKNRDEYEQYRASFPSREAYAQAHSLPLGYGVGAGALPLSEWSLWETLELLENERFKDLLHTHTLHGKR